MTITNSNLANAMIKLVAVDAVSMLHEMLTEAELTSQFTVDFQPVEAMVGDTVDSIKLTTHMEASFVIPDVHKVLAVPELLYLYMHPAIGALAEELKSDFLSPAIRLAVRRLGGIPPPGILVEYGEGGGLGIRVQMRYQPETRQQVFTVEMLYGVGAAS